MTKTNKTETAKPATMWRPPVGWFKAALAARAEIAHRQWLAEWNARRRQFGLPEVGQ